MTVPLSIYPRPISGVKLKQGLQHMDRRQRERFFLLVVRMVGRERERRWAAHDGGPYGVA